MKKYNKWAALLGGYLGLHRYMAGEIGMGFLYTITFGLFGFGWVIDTAKAFLQKNEAEPRKFYIPLKKLPTIHPTGIILGEGELCHYQGPAYTEKTTDRVAGYTSQYGGGSVRLAKGLSIHSGGNTKQAVRESVTEKDNGMLYLTNKRVIFTSIKHSFDKSIYSLSAYMPSGNHIIFQFGSHSYDLITQDSFRIRDIIDGVINGMPIE